ncbi:hypothetical protein PR048_015520 [Dryococelus australis]|uniref:Uncharacterized protein n=1 Tax=Dryococelus australis TaxID=614101 RepID=A0ABQ9HH54_9NEOP|nr:hypothetical protein PR048_015520 [Dryococelus australis]
MSILVANKIPDIVYMDQGRHIQTIKCLFKKAAQNGKNIYLALLEYRNMPIEPGLSSSSELLNSRRLLGLVPMSEPVLTSKIETSIVSKLEHLRLLQKEQYDGEARDLPPLQAGQKVKDRRIDTY